MPGRRILIVYGTRYGQTAKVAGRIADLLTSAGDTVVVENADDLQPMLVPRNFDGVIVGGSIIYGHHQRSVRRFVRTHRDELNAMPSAFFSVSGSAASRDEASR
ncbi:MAG TPA: flavodoxin domain-containing protein, partial [Gemmatimonadaceae bacterium]|nr:flavodoxin domain-containing protein [Gemmatimonadaceae bacterium]